MKVVALLVLAFGAYSAGVLYRAGGERGQPAGVLVGDANSHTRASGPPPREVASSQRETSQDDAGAGAEALPSTPSEAAAKQIASDEDLLAVLGPESVRRLEEQRLTERFLALADYWRSSEPDAERFERIATALVSSFGEHRSRYLQIIASDLSLEQKDQRIMASRKQQWDMVRSRLAGLVPADAFEDAMRAIGAPESDE